MSPLVLYDEQRDYLDLEDDTDQEVIEALLDEVTQLFEKECGRGGAPFAGAQTGRSEIHEGSAGSRIITLDYPIASVTSIVVGSDVALPDETLIPSDPGAVVWRVGGRTLTRTDGRVWRRSSPRWVKVVYNTQADLPADAKLAIKRVVAAVYQQKGKEGFTSVTRGARSWTMAEAAAAQDPFWQSAVRNQPRVWIR